MELFFKLLLVLLFFIRATKQSENETITTELPDDSTVKTYRACTFDGNIYGHGEYIDVKEPCLNCSCNRGLLSCYRKACSTLTFRPECKLEKQPNICCPVLVCGNNAEDSSSEETLDEEMFAFQNSTDIGDILNGAQNSSFIEEIQETIDMFDQNITEVNYEETGDDANYTDNSVIPTPTTMDPFDEPIHRNIIRESRKQNEDSYNVIFVTENSVEMPQQLPENACFHRGSIFSEGSAMESDELCQNCFCLGGSRKCMKSRCSLQIPGCIAEYDFDFSCCPNSYNCTGIEATPVTTTSTTKAPSIAKCWVENITYSLGDRIYKSNPCEICYCTASGIECDNILCESPEDETCTPVIEDGECCPVAYNCSKEDIQTFTMEIFQDSSTVPFESIPESFDTIDEHNGTDINVTIYDNKSENETKPLYSSEKNGTSTGHEEEGEKMSASMLSSIIRDITNNLKQLAKVFYRKNKNSTIPSRFESEHSTDLQNSTSGDLEEKFEGLLSQSQTGAEESVEISLNHGDVNDTVMALLLERVFGSNSENGGTVFESTNYTNENVNIAGNMPSNDSKTVETLDVDDKVLQEGTKPEIRNEDNAASSSEIKPAFLSPSLLKDISNGAVIKSNYNKKQEQNEVKKTVSTTESQKDDGFTPTTPSNLNKYQPQFIDASSLADIKYSPENNDFSDRIGLEEPARKPVRENDRLINILDVEHLLEQQFDLRKIPPHLLSKIKSPLRKPLYKKPNKKPIRTSTKNKPPSMFGPPPTLPPKLVASLLSMLNPNQYVNNRVNRGDFSAELRHQEGPRRSEEWYKRGRKETAPDEEEVASETKPNIKFIPFVAADAVGHEDNMKDKKTIKPSMDAILEYISEKAHQCTVGDKQFENGDHVPRNDPCVGCRCLYGEVLCKKEKCSPTPPGCTSIKMEGDCCPVHSCGEGLVQIVNNQSYQKNKDKVATEKPVGEKSTTEGRIESFDSVFKVIDKENVSNTQHNPFKDDSTKVQSFQFPNKQSTSAPTKVTIDIQVPSTVKEATKTTITQNQETTTTSKPQTLDVSISTQKDIKEDEPKTKESDDTGTYVASVDVVPIGKKPSGQAIQVGSSSNNEQIYSVGSVLHFAVEKDQKIIEDGGILTSAKKPGVDPFDVLSDLFVPEGDTEEEQINDKNKVVKDWSSSIQQGSSPGLAIRRTTRRPETHRTGSPTRRPETTTKATRRTLVPKLTKTFIKSTKSPKTTVKYRTPISTTTRRRTTTTTTTTTQKPFIDIAKPTVAGHFLDPWGLLKVSGCSYNGKTFMVGADIPELGNVCKRCSCSPMGVVCQELTC